MSSAFASGCSRIPTDLLITMLLEPPLYHLSAFLFSGVTLPAKGRDRDHIRRNHESQFSAPFQTNALQIHRPVNCGWKTSGRARMEPTLMLPVTSLHNQLSAIAELRWRMFINRLRTRRGKVELVSRIIVGSF